MLKVLILSETDVKLFSLASLLSESESLTELKLAGIEKMVGPTKLFKSGI